MWFQEGSQRSAITNSSSWKVEEECRPRECLPGFTNRPFKAFDCLPHNLLIAKLNAYGFDSKAGRLIYDYLTSRKQGTKISDTYSSWQEILSGVPPRFNTWTIIIQQWHMRFIFHHKGLRYCKLCRWQCPIFKRGKRWESFKWFREGVV